MEKIKQLLNDKIKITGFVFSLICAYLLFPSFLALDIYPVSEGASLDPSWAVTLNYANFQNLNWGNDIAFTYGPLSYLAIKMGWNCKAIYFLLFDLFYAINLFFLFYDNFSKSKNKIIVAIFIALVVLFLPNYLGGGNALVFYFFLLFWIKKNTDKVALINYVFQILIVVLLFFIKFNTGLVCFLLFVFSLIYLGFFKLEKITLLLFYLIAPIILIVLFSQILNVSILNYIKVGLEMVSGYNEIMYLRAEDYEKLHPTSLLLIIITVIFFVYKMYIEKGKLFKNIFVFVLFLSGLFILYKQAFLRADLPHIMEFFKFFPLLVLGLSCFFEFSFKNKINLFLIPIFVIPVYVVANNEPNLFVSIKDKTSKKGYIDSYSSYTPTSTFKLFPNNNQLPQSVLNKVKDNTIDIFPWNIQLLYENKLNYLPRPVIQSYTAYTPYLEDLNFNHYNSSKAPKFVLFDYKSINATYPLLDESKVHLVLFKNYQLVESFIFQERKLLLLERKSDFKPISLILQNEYALLLNSPLVIKENCFYEVELYNSVNGKIKSFMEYAPEVVLNIKTSNNRLIDFKSSKAQLKTGLFFTHFIESTDDFEKVLKNDSLDATNQIKSFSFKVKDQYFKEKIRVKEYKIKQ